VPVIWPILAASRGNGNSYSHRGPFDSTVSDTAFLGFHGERRNAQNGQFCTRQQQQR
jgi:hypothetical protein